MKKTLFLFLFLLFSIFSLFATSDFYIGIGAEGKRFVFYETTLQGFSTNEAVWLPYSILSNIKTYFSLYSGMTVVDNENDSEITEYQRLIEKAAYDETTNEIELGNFQVAQYAVFSSVVKTGNTYMLSCNITDYNTKTEISRYVVNNISSIDDGLNTEIKTLTLNILPQLGVVLTPLARHNLSSESTNTSIAEQYELEMQSIQSSTNILNELNTELRKYNTSEALFNESQRLEQAQVKAKIAMMEAQKNAAERRAELLLKQKEKEAEEAIKSLERNSKTNETLSKLASSIEEAASKIRQTQFNNMNCEEKIEMLETKKSTFIEIRNSVEVQKAQIEIQAEKDYKAQKKDVEDFNNYSEFYIGYDKKGNKYILEEAKIKLSKENEALKKKIDSNTKEQIKEIDSNTKTQLSSLLQEIKNDENRLRNNVEKDSSLTNNYLFFVDKFNGATRSWLANVQIFFANQILISDEINISFDLLKKEFVKNFIGINNFELNDEELFQFFDSMFRTNTPFVYLEVDYKIEPLKENFPSQYNITALEYRLINSKTQKVIEKIDVKNKNSQFKYRTENDIRTQEQKKLDSLAKIKEQNKAHKKVVMDYEYNQKNWKGARTTLGVNYGIEYGKNTIESNIEIDGTFSIFTPYSYTRYSYLSTVNTNKKNLNGMYFAFGLNKRFNLFNISLYPNLFFDIGSLCEFSEKNTTGFRTTVGVDIPMDSFAITMQYSFNFLNAWQFFDIFSIGIRINSVFCAMSVVWN